MGRAGREAPGVVWLGGPEPREQEHSVKTQPPADGQRTGQSASWQPAACCSGRCNDDKSGCAFSELFNEKGKLESTYRCVPVLLADIYFDKRNCLVACFILPVGCSL